MKGWRRKGGKGRPVVYKTWFAVWMSMKQITIDEFAKICLVSTPSVERWRAGRVMSPHMAKLIKAWFPDAPIHAYGGPVVLLKEPLPMCSRSAEMYKFIFRLGGMIDDLAHPAALAKARGLGPKA